MSRRVRFRGCIHANLRDKLSYEGTPKTREQQLEMTHDMMNKVMASLNGVPVSTEHNALGRCDVGTIDGCYYDREGKAYVTGLLDSPEKNAAAKMVEACLESGVLTGLSLSHDAVTLKPYEVSLCLQGARPGTGITEIARVNASTAASAPAQPGATSQDGAYNMTFRVDPKAGTVTIPIQPQSSDKYRTLTTDFSVIGTVVEASGTPVDKSSTGVYQTPASEKKTDPAMEAPPTKKRKIDASEPAAEPNASPAPMDTDQPVAESSTAAEPTQQTETKAEDLESILEQFVSHKGAFSDTKKAQLLRAVAALKAKGIEADKQKEQAADLARREQETTRNTQTLFMNTLLPMLRKMVPQTQEMESRLNRIGEMDPQARAVDLMSTMQPVLASASMVQTMRENKPESELNAAMRLFKSIGTTAVPSNSSQAQPAAGGAGAGAGAGASAPVRASSAAGSKARDVGSMLRSAFEENAHKQLTMRF